MNDGNDKHEGAWWGNLETLKPSQVQSDYSYVDEDDRRKKFIIIAAAIGIVLVLLLGGFAAFTVISTLLPSIIPPGPTAITVAI